MGEYRLAQRFDVVGSDVRPPVNSGPACPARTNARLAPVTGRHARVRFHEQPPQYRGYTFDRVCDVNVAYLLRRSRISSGPSTDETASEAGDSMSCDRLMSSRSASRSGGSIEIVNWNRSRCDFGRSNVPSVSTEFLVAMTMNGSGSESVSPSMVTVFLPSPPRGPTVPSVSRG